MSYNHETNMYEGFIYKIYNDINDRIYIGQTKTTIKERWHGHMSAVLNEKRYKSALYNAMRKYGREKFHIIEIDKIMKNTLEELIISLNELEQRRISEHHSLITENGYNLEKGGNNKIVSGRSICKYDAELNLLDTYISIREAARQNNINETTIWSVCKHYFYTAGGYVWAYKGETPIKPDYDKIHNPLNYRQSKKKAYISKAMPIETKIQRKLDRLVWDNKRKIFQYNSYGELINIFENILEASQKLEVSPREIQLNLSGINLCLGKTVLRYEDEPFNKFPCSIYLQPITLYDLQGNFVSNFESKHDAGQFLGVSSGEITKVLKRGGSCKGYLLAEYGKPLERKLLCNTKTILMCDEKFNVLKEFNSISDINYFFKLVDCHHGLNKAIKNKTKYKGYYWKYKDEFALTA